MEHIRLDSVDSTNSHVRRMAASLPDLVMVTAADQTAGRGQRGNKWESAPGLNLTFSVLWRPRCFAARDQFAISEATALAVTDTLAAYGIAARVKWPNDIYVDDRKICGILIEHSVMGTDIMHTVIGAGININQRTFVSDAPNPVSMYRLLDAETDIEAVRRVVAANLENRLRPLDTGLDSGRREALHDEFMNRLWRGDGQYHPYRDTATGRLFDARIEDVGPLGHLHLLTRDGENLRYAFKEVAAVL